MFTHTINPVIAKIWIFEIRYYGLMYVLAFIIAYFLIKKLSEERRLGFERYHIEDLLIYIVIGLIVGARLFYVVFYNLGFYLENPMEIFMIWHGGLSFHGALLGIIAMVFVYCKKRDFNFYEIADICVIPAAIGLFFGRIGNFINGELYGRITQMPWAVKFPDAEGFRHPSQIYEALKNLFIFTVLWSKRNKNLPPGFLFWTFIVMYSALRFGIEFFRAPDPQIGFVIIGLTMGQVLSIIMFFIGMVFLMRLFERGE